MTLLFAVLFGSWALLSTFGQFRGRVVSRIRGMDPFSLIPRWTFFAPNPGTTDYHLLHRDQYVDGSLGEFQEDPLGNTRSLLHALWNPGKLPSKALTDAVQILPRLADDVTVPGLRTTLPYLALLNYVSELNRSPLVTGRQFVIVQTLGYLHGPAAGATFVSELHRLDEPIQKGRRG